MATVDEPTVYRLSAIARVFSVAFAAIFGLAGVGMLADFRHTGWPGVVCGALVVMVMTYGICSLLTTSVTIHEQGVVIRRYLRRKFIPWQAVAEITCGTDGRIFSTYSVSLRIPTGVRYIDRWESLDGTQGSHARVSAIVAEMREFQRRELDARLSQADGAEQVLPEPPGPGVPRHLDRPADDGPARGRGVP